MKVGDEVHFLAGQIFTLGVAAVAVVPRMPSDGARSCWSIGGKLSFPFRRVLLCLIAIGIIRVIGFHLHRKDSQLLRLCDAILGSLHVMAQSFLCMSTAYLLQCQLSNYINTDQSRRSLIPFLILVLFLAVLGSFLSELLHPNWWCLVNLAEASSAIPVLRTLKLHASVTTIGGHHHGRGPISTQTLVVIEYWYLVMSLLSFLAEAFDDVHTSSDPSSLEEDRPMQLLFQAIRHNHDNGVDDWVRLLMHSVFLNSIDELHHVQTTASSNDNNNESTSSEESSFEHVQNERDETALKVVRRRTERVLHNI